MKYQSIKKTVLALCWSIVLFLDPCSSFGLHSASNASPRVVSHLCVDPKREVANCAFGRRSLVSSSQLSSLTVLNYKNLDDHEELQQQEKLHRSQKIVSPSDSSSESQVVADLVKPRDIDLPKSAFIKTNKEQNEKMLLAIEMFIGRVAMIAAIFLFVEEVWKATA